MTKGTRADEVNAYSKRSVLGNIEKKLNLKENIRAHSADSELAKLFLMLESESVIMDKQAYEPPKSRKSPRFMDIHDHRIIIELTTLLGKNRISNGGTNRMMKGEWGDGGEWVTKILIHALPL
ncbi:hypothetical protein EVAR_66434_1 [Eumeta japonica]|uniref:Uncharacterized protein n=1 Tax=Eumeta variegata TaxID=151549 RepID=A0A4C1ZH02_EUMVA|nr:hypothetical protein EVAR_66434_1 [Eumeta japonica]